MLAESVRWWCEYEKAERSYLNTHCLDVQVCSYKKNLFNEIIFFFYLAICWLVRPYLMRSNQIQKISCANNIKWPKRTCSICIIYPILTILNLKTLLLNISPIKPVHNGNSLEHSIFRLLSLQRSVRNFVFVYIIFLLFLFRIFI
jgi:hypothetical protein